jgi:hypothetical protein
MNHPNTQPAVAAFLLHHWSDMPRTTSEGRPRSGPSPLRHLYVSAVRLTVVAWAIALPGAAFAQDTREGIHTAEQAAKAGQLKAYRPSRGEEILDRVTQRLTLAPSGFYPYFGSVYSGGGFTLGAAYRQFVSDRTSLTVSGLYSIKNYKLIDATYDVPAVRKRPQLTFKVGWRDATQVAYHGLSIDSPEDRTSFRMEQAYGGAEVTARPGGWTVFRGGVTFEDFTLSEGSGSAPSIEEVFTPATAPGLGQNPTYVHALASAGIDTRPAAGYARRGGLYEVVYHNYNDSDDSLSFDLLETQVVQHIPVLRENWVFSLRGELRSALHEEDTVPFFLLPHLGSGSTLRGYSSWRFRDRHSLLFSGEYRWIPNRLAFDAALFYDTGMVADRFEALTIGRFMSDFGFGVRFHSPVATPLRIELAKGSEGLRLVFAGSAAF